MDGRRYDSMEGIGTTTGKWEVELRREQQPRVESGTETENNTRTMFMEEQVSREGRDSPQRLNYRDDTQIERVF